MHCMATKTSMGGGESACEASFSWDTLLHGKFSTEKVLWDPILAWQPGTEELDQDW